MKQHHDYKPPIGELADDKCEACRKETATKECGHGILCPKCYREVHGSQECDL